MNQKVLIPFLVALLITVILSGYFIYQSQTNPLSQKITNAEEYCKSVNSVKAEYEKVQSVSDCGEYKITYPDGCIDCANGILDKNWKGINSCGGLGGWSKECQEKYPWNNSCITTSCKEVSQKKFEETSCTKDEECSFAKCACRAVNKKYSSGLICTIACKGTPKCINNKCTLVKL